MPAASATDADLILLFLGDKLSLGYYHPNLPRELCRRINPATFQRLCAAVFGAVETIEPDAYEALQEGYDWWESDGRPKVEHARG